MSLVGAWSGWNWNTMTNLPNIFYHFIGYFPTGSPIILSQRNLRLHHNGKVFELWLGHWFSVAPKGYNIRIFWCRDVFPCIYMLFFNAQDNNRPGCNNEGNLILHFLSSGCHNFWFAFENFIVNEMVLHKSLYVVYYVIALLVSIFMWWTHNSYSLFHVFLKDWPEKNAN